MDRRQHSGWGPWLVTLVVLTEGCWHVQAPETAAWSPPTLPVIQGAYSVETDLVWSPRESLGVGPGALAWATLEDETLLALRAVDGHERETLFLLHIDGEGNSTAHSLPASGRTRQLDVVATEGAFLLLLGDSLHRVHHADRLHVERLANEHAQRGNPIEECSGGARGAFPQVRRFSSTRAQAELRQQPRPDMIQGGPGRSWILPVVSVPADGCRHPGLCLNFIHPEHGAVGQWCDLDAPPFDSWRGEDGSADGRWVLCGPEANEARALYEALDERAPDWTSYCAGAPIQNAYQVPASPPDVLSDAVWTIAEAFIRRRVHDPWNTHDPLADVLTTATGTWVTWTEVLRHGEIVLRTARVASRGLPGPYLADIPIPRSLGRLDARDTRHGLLVVGHDHANGTTLFWPEAAVSHALPAVQVTVDEEGSVWACTQLPPARCGRLVPNGPDLRPASRCGWPLPMRDALLVLAELGSPTRAVTLVDAQTGEVRVAPREGTTVETVAVLGGFGWYADGSRIWRVSDNAIELADEWAAGLTVLRAGTAGLRGLSREAGVADLRSWGEIHFVASFAGDGWSVDGPTSSMFWPGFGVVEESLTGELVRVRFTPSMRVALHAKVLAP